MENILKNISPVKANGNHLSPIPKKTTCKEIYEGVILSNTNLNGRGSAKQTHHIEVNSPRVHYQPGDAIGVVPENTAEIVNGIIQAVNINPNKKIDYKNEEITLFDLLQKKLNIAYLPERVIKQYASIVRQEIPS